MITQIVNFTPVSATVGGLFIGLAAVLLLVTNGRIAGVSGMLHGAVRAAPPRAMRLFFLAGLVLGALGYVALFPGDLGPRDDFPTVLLVVGGLLVGIGTRLGSGCTSGHGVCGIARLSPRSIVATLIFMAIGIATASLLLPLFGVAT